MTQMTKGANIPIAAPMVRATLFWTGGPGIPDVDGSALLLKPDGKVDTEDDFVFYNQPQHPSGCVRQAGTSLANPGSTACYDVIDVNLVLVPAGVDRIAFGASADGGTFGQVPDLRLVLSDLSNGSELAVFAMSAASETAFVTGELYRRDGTWKFRAIGQGYDSGLAGLATDFGISVNDDTTDVSSAPPSAPDAPVLPPPSWDVPPPPTVLPPPVVAPAAAAPPVAPTPTPPPVVAPAAAAPPVAPTPTPPPVVAPAAAAPPVAPTPTPPPVVAPAAAAPPVAPTPTPPPVVPPPFVEPPAVPDPASLDLAPPVALTPPPPVVEPPAPTPAPPAPPATPAAPTPDASQWGIAPPPPPTDWNAPAAPVVSPPPPATPEPTQPAAAPTLGDGPISLVKNQRVELQTAQAGPLNRIMMQLGWESGPAKKAVDLDGSVIAFNADGEKQCIVWYQHRDEYMAALQHAGDNQGDVAGGSFAETIYVELSRLPESCNSLVFTINSFKGQTFTDIERAYVVLSDDQGNQLLRYDLTDTQPSTALLIAVIKRSGPGIWHLRAIGEFHDCRTVRKLVYPAARQSQM